MKMVDTIQHQIHEIESNPEVGARLSLFSIFIGFVINITREGHINPLLMDILQAGAWLTGIIVGIFTIIGYVKKLFTYVKLKFKNE